jgi:TnpA family transposase
VIVRKLSSHKRYCRLSAALWEYNKIFKSIHVLNLINDVTLRKVLKKSRNRTEAYHQLQRTIRKVHSGVFIGKNIVNNAVNMHASRLIANCIIAYNAILLNAVYLRLVKKVGEEKAKKIIGRISPVAWQHLIFTGRYRFANGQNGIDLEQFVEMLERKLDEIANK